MSRKSKWIEAKSADEYAPDVARRAIGPRPRTLWNWLPLAAKNADDDVEYVHQLRVASRRAMAVLEIFDAMLPRKRSKWLTRQLKRIRKAAGDARDLDVFGATIDNCVRRRPLRPRESHCWNVWHWRGVPPNHRLARSIAS